MSETPFTRTIARELADTFRRTFRWLGMEDDVTVSLVGPNDDTVSVDHDAGEFRVAVTESPGTIELGKRSVAFRVPEYAISAACVNLHAGIGDPATEYIPLERCRDTSAVVANIVGRMAGNFVDASMRHFYELQYDRGPAPLAPGLVP